MISPRSRDRLAAPLVVVYWATLVTGLGLYSWLRSDAIDGEALWIGALAGSALGQTLALKNVRAWLAAAIVVGVALLIAPLLAVGAAPPTWWQSLLTAALCGYWSLGERTAPAAFWFPAMIWMLSIVDRVDGLDAAASLDARAFALLGGVAAAFLALLWAAERRRLGLWSRVGAAPVTPGRVTTLREPAGRPMARVGFGAAVVALTLALTAWVAPHLWQSETLGGERLTEFADGIGVGDAGGLPCCPLVSSEAPRVRVREFLDVAHGVMRPPAQVGVNCVACPRGGIVAAAGGGINATASTAMTPSQPRFAPSTWARPPSATVAASAVDPVAVAPTTPPPAPTRPAPPPSTDPVAPAPRIAEPTPLAQPAAPPLPRAPSPSPPLAATMRPAPQRTPADARALLRLILTLLVGAAAFAAATLTLRPLRRAITLRHLRRPYWAESLEQRVSNLWQLTLVGPRDAGFRARAGEQPEELARRVRVDGVGACASVLERARHGLGVESGELSAMHETADLAYRAARARLGWLARLAAALRWPLA